MIGSVECRKQCALFGTLALLLVVIASTGCSYRSDVIHSIEPPPWASDEVKRELHELEGTDQCVETRDYLIEEIAPYLISIRAAMD